MTHPSASPIPEARESAQPRLLLLLIHVLALGTLCSCAALTPRADPTRFFLLSSGESAKETTPRPDALAWRVALRSVELPAYLRGRPMVLRTGSNELRFADYDRWAEPLVEGITRVLGASMGSSSNAVMVSADHPADQELDYQIRVQVLSFEGSQAGKEAGLAHVSLAWDARPTGKRAKSAAHGVFTSGQLAWNGSDYGQLAARLSEALFEGGQAIARSLPQEAEK